jgi:hypothetical protein
MSVDVAQLSPIDKPDDAPAEDDFDWYHDDSIVLTEQPAFAVYSGRHHVVIRQQANYPDEDSYVIVAPHNLPRLIDRLRELAGIPKAGKRR